MKFKFPIGTKVYHVMDGETQGIVTGILLRQGCHIYYVTWPDRAETPHYEFELTAEKSFSPAS